MIGFLKGEVADIGSDHILIDCGGVGYRVFMSANDIAAAASMQEIKVYTDLYLREEIIALYGFLEKEDLALFEQLITVSGVGPKAAMNLFSVMRGNDIKFAILSDDVTAICKAPGIGRKTAQKLILELKDKFSLDDAFEERMQTGSAVPAGTSEDQAVALEALVSLEYTAAEAKSALRKCKSEEPGPEPLIREALKYLY